MSLKYLSAPTKILAESISSTATSFKLNNITGWDGVNLTSADYGSQAYGVFRNSVNTQLELFEFDPTTIGNASITIVRRGLKFTGDLTTEVTANKLSWVKGDTQVDLGVDSPQMLQWIQEYIDAAIVAGGVPATTTVLGLSKMSTTPADAANPIAVGTNDTRVPTQDENNALAGDKGTPSSSNPYRLKSFTLNAGETINGATLPVPVYQSTADNELYACDANDNTKYKFLGFAVSNSTNGNPISLQISGIVSGFTGLTEGVSYYVQDTAGTIGVTPGTQEILVGCAISETELLIRKGTFFANGSSNLGSTTASGSSAVTLGFRPSKIRLFMQSRSNDTAHSRLELAWVSSTTTALSSYHSSATSSVSTENRLYDTNGTEYLTVTITSVTDNGFTITWTETGAFSEDVSFIWEAEGQY